MGHYAGAPTRPVPTSMSPLGSEPTYEIHHRAKEQDNGSRKDEVELSDKPMMKDFWTYIPRFFIVRYNLFMVSSHLNCSP